MSNEFYVGYGEGAGPKTKRILRRFVIGAIAATLLSALVFVFNQAQAVDSRFDFASPSTISGVYYENPYPLLRLSLGEGKVKDVVLLGFGKFGSQKYLEAFREPGKSLAGRRMEVKGNLIYYNGGSFLQISEEQDIKLLSDKIVTDEFPNFLGERTVEGEIVDPKCYFGVMKPGYGKIHRSCAALCISGGIPPVLVERIEEQERHYLITDQNGRPVHREIIPYIAQAARLKGQLTIRGTWNYLAVNLEEIELLDKDSDIFPPETP